MAVLAERVEQNGEVFWCRFGIGKCVDIVEGSNGLASETRRNEASNEGEKSGMCWGEFSLVHFDYELPCDVELMNTGHDIDEEVVGRK